MNDDELISAYVDGRMSEPGRAAFEARVQTDAALRRQVAVTRLLVDQSRQVEIMLPPKNFILPQDFGKAAQPAPPAKRFDGRSLFFRLGSVAAAMVFVFAVAFDALRSAPPVTPAAAPMAAPIQATSPAEAAITTNVEPVTATTAPEQAPAAGAVAMPMTQSRAILTDVMSTMEMDVTVAPLEVTTESMTGTLPDAASAKRLPMPPTQAYEAPVSSAPPAPLITPLRAIAALALLLAIALGLMGRRK